MKKSLQATIAAILLVVSLSVFASPFQGAQGIQGPVGNTGATGATGLSFSSAEAYGAIASMGAMANIPTLSKFSTGNTGVGVGIGRYKEEEALALGVVHHVGDWSLKAAVSQARGDSATYGVGATLTF